MDLTIEWLELPERWILFGGIRKTGNSFSKIRNKDFLLLKNWVVNAF